jgi:hypothetical protein
MNRLPMRKEKWKVQIILPNIKCPFNLYDTHCNSPDEKEPLPLCTEEGCKYRVVEYKPYERWESCVNFDCGIRSDDDTEWLDPPSCPHTDLDGDPSDFGCETCGFYKKSDLYKLEDKLIEEKLNMS